MVHVVMDRRRSHYDKQLPSKIRVTPFTLRETHQFGFMDECVENFSDYIKQMKTEAKKQVIKRTNSRNTVCLSNTDNNFKFEIIFDANKVLTLENIKLKNRVNQVEEEVKS